MKPALKKLEDIFAAAAFAESGEHDFARKVADIREPDKDGPEDPAPVAELETA